MDKIESFQIDHEKLLRGVYVSREDKVNDNVVTTFDIRMKRPNKEPVLNIAPLHTIEHLGATYLRTIVDKEISKDVIYFGPMGCRTGFYLIMAGDRSSSDIINLLKNMFSYMAKYDGEIPGASPKECGNYLDQNLPIAKYESEKFYVEILENIKQENLVYPK